MYSNIMEQLQTQELMRKEEFLGEFDQLITLIRIYSDHWLVSSSIYDNAPEQEKIIKHAYLLLSFFYPYLTEKGKIQYNELR